MWTCRRILLKQPNTKFDGSVFTGSTGTVVVVVVLVIIEEFDVIVTAVVEYYLIFL